LHKNQDFPVHKYLELYRFHYPEISLSEDAFEFLNKIVEKNIGFSIVTDGRSVSQNNKIKALGISHLVQNIIISEETGYEKPHVNNFEVIVKSYPDKRLLYIADNPAKDFLAPNILKWDTICILDNGQNIHSQSFDMDFDYLPKTKINSFNEIIL
jgi:putative hydrolase of the HAD superfamily